MFVASIFNLKGTKFVYRKKCDHYFKNIFLLSIYLHEHLFLTVFIYITSHELYIYNTCIFLKAPQNLTKKNNKKYIKDYIGLLGLLKTIRGKQG